MKEKHRIGLTGAAGYLMQALSEGTQPDPLCLGPEWGVRAERGAYQQRRSPRKRLALRIAGASIAAAALFASGTVFGRTFSKPVSSGPNESGSAKIGFGEGLLASDSPAPAHAHAQGAQLSGAPQDLLDQRLAQIRAATLKYREVSVAESEGFRLVVRELPEMGAHFVKVSNTPATTFEPTQPNMLLYERSSGGWELLAVGYILSNDSFPRPPEYFPNAQWHFHQSLCIFASGSVAIMPREECQSKQGFWVSDTGWMLHVWLYRDNPSGVFSELNPVVSGRSN